MCKGGAGPIQKIGVATVWWCSKVVCISRCHSRQTLFVMLHLLINARIVFPSVCLSVRMCSFFESLAGPFSTLVGSFNSFLRCADSDGLTFLNFKPFSLCVPVHAAHSVFNIY